MRKILFSLILLPWVAFCGGTPTLTISKSADGNETLTYTIGYENKGNGTATYCTIYDQVPEGCEYVGTGTIDLSYGTATIYYSKNGGTNWQETDPGTETKAIKWRLNEKVPPQGTGTTKFKVKRKQK
ncbi:MAG: hypothetical protein AAB296_10580 [Candidatus Desantisbacteria bacterium]